LLDFAEVHPFLANKVKDKQSSALTTSGNKKQAGRPKMSSRTSIDEKKRYD
jgi:hypothetical protein